jgi:hypothetical protein
VAWCDVAAGAAVSVHRQVVERASRRPLVVFDDTTSGVVAGSGWSVSDLRTWVRADGSEMQFRATFERTGAAITVSGAGNIADELVATLPVRARGTVSASLPVWSWSGRVASCRYVPSTGELWLNAVATGSNIATGEVFGVGGVVWMVQ